MAGTMCSEKPSLKLKLLVDKTRERVVLAEAGKDFIDVLFSFLTLPMGTVVRLVEKRYHQNQKSQDSTTIGCFNNIYKSVGYLGTSSFMTEACKDMLLYPRSVMKKEKQRRRLKLNIGDTEINKYYVCSKVDSESTCPKVFSDFCSSRCCCGMLMEKAFIRLLGVECDEHFVSDKTLFTITNDMKVGFASMGLILKTLQGLGYNDVNQLHEMVVDVDHEKVLALLRCIFYSDTPLTDVFLTKICSCRFIRPPNKLSPPINGGEEAEPKEVISISVFTRNLDKKVLYVESGKDFVDLLFTFLALPLNSAWEISGSNIALGCIDNLCESFKMLSYSKGRNALTNICWLPWYYKCKKPLLDVHYGEREMDRLVRIKKENLYLKAMDPRCDKNVGSGICNGFVKRETSFIISDDLVIAPMNLSSSIFTLKKWDMDLDDIEEQVINISKAEAMRLLRASFMTSTALTTAFGNLLSKKPAE